MKLKSTTYKHWVLNYGSKERYVVNMFDIGFKGMSMVESECLSGGKELRKPKHVHYVFFKPKWHGITYYTEKYIKESVLDSTKSAFRVCILTEPRHVQAAAYAEAERLIDRFDLVLTHEQDILDRYPDKARYLMVSCPAIGYSHIRMHEKTKLVSYMFSKKKITEGHKLRHFMYEKLQDDSRIDFVDYYGSGVGEYIMEKSPSMDPYMFSIIIENGFKEHYFTEKIMDCFATGTIPIYKGCPSISKFFNPKGILTFDTADELKEILLGLSEGKYFEMLEVAKENYNKVFDFMDPDDIALDEVRKFILETGFKFKNKSVVKKLKDY